MIFSAITNMYLNGSGATVAYLGGIQVWPLETYSPLCYVYADLGTTTGNNKDLRLGTPLNLADFTLRLKATTRQYTNGAWAGVSPTRFFGFNATNTYWDMASGSSYNRMSVNTLNYGFGSGETFDVELKNHSIYNLTNNKGATGTTSVISGYSANNIMVRLSHLYVYEIEVKDGNTVTGLYKPVMRNSDNACGLYDTITNTFYTTTAFTIYGGTCTEVSISPEGDTFAESGETKTITVASNGPWTATTQDSYVSISPNTGVSGITTVSITAGPNAGNSRNVFAMFNDVEYHGYQEAGVTGITAITYTSSDSKIVQPYNTTGWGANIVSNVYGNGVGKIAFDDVITGVPNYAFSGCTSLTSVVLSDTIKTIGDYAFSNGITAVYHVPLSSVTLPSGLTSIGEEAFAHNKLTSVSIPETVTSIGMNAFAWNLKLTTVNISSATPITAFTQSVFGRCDILQSIVIPSAVTQIDYMAFYKCGFDTIYSYPTVAPIYASYSFDRVKSGGVLHYPAGSDYSSWLGAGALPNWTGVADL